MLLSLLPALLIMAAGCGEREPEVPQGAGGSAEISVEDIGFGEAMAQIRGHHLVSLELYEAGDTEGAAVHAGHPVHEILDSVRASSTSTTPRSSEQISNVPSMTGWKRLRSGASAGRDSRDVRRGRGRDRRCTGCRRWGSGRGVLVPGFGHLGSARDRGARVRGGRRRREGPSARGVPGRLRVRAGGKESLRGDRERRRGRVVRRRPKRSKRHSPNSMPHCPHPNHRRTLPTNST